jgi:hypothetical protein
VHEASACTQHLEELIKQNMKRWATLEATLAQRRHDIAQEMQQLQQRLADVDKEEQQFKAEIAQQERAAQDKAVLVCGQLVQRLDGGPGA